jgi:hypothetical protein
MRWKEKGLVNSFLAKATGSFSRNLLSAFSDLEFGNPISQFVYYSFLLPYFGINIYLFVL